MSINMGRLKKRPISRPAPTIYACRLLPLRIALLGADAIKQLPVIYELEKGVSIADLLRKRTRTLIELKLEKLDSQKDEFSL